MQRITTVIASALFFASILSTLATTLPVAEDTFGSLKGDITAANGKATTLLLNSNDAALVKFDLSSLPAAYAATNIASARLIFYVVMTRTPGNITANVITSDWTESVSSNTPTPASDATIVGTAPAAKVLGKHFVSIDVTASVIAALNGGTNFGFLLSDKSGQTFIASKEGPSQGPAAELEIDANLAQNGSGGGVFPGTFNIGGDLNLAGLLRQGTETGTDEPAGRGIIVRRIQSTNSAAGSIVARTDTLMLERDGTTGGWVVVNTANPGNATIYASGLDVNGRPVVQAIVLGPDPFPAQTNTLFQDSQGVGYFQCAFGNAYEVGHETEVTLIRSPNLGGTNWIGTMISSYNQ